MTEDICRRPVSELAELLRSRQCSPVDLAGVFIERVGRLNPKLHAFITLTADDAIRGARKAEAEIARGGWRGPLHGIPFGLKDMINTAGIRTTAHSRALEGNVPAVDATVTRRLYDAGAVLMGKLATHEFAHGGPSFDLPWPPARNPWDTERSPGGSSSGSAAAVAAGLVPFALGTDTGGSIRIPSWLCGTVGFKPTFGRVSRAGVIPYSDSCDHVGPITRTVRDAAIVLNALHGEDARDRAARPAPSIDLRTLDAGIKGLRIGFVRHFSERDVEVDPELRAAVDEALRVLGQLGAIVEDVTLRPLQTYYPVRLVISETDLFSLHLKQFQRDPGVYGHHLLARCLPACLFRASDYVRAQRERRRMILELQQVFEDYDLLVTVGAGPAPLITDLAGVGSHAWAGPNPSALVCTPASLAGLPALALCCGYSGQGLPLGMQIIGRAWEDELVLRTGHAYETQTQWGGRRPLCSVESPRQPDPAQAAHGAPLAPAAIEDGLTHTVDAALRSAGLVELEARYRNIVLGAAPHVLELARRIPQAFGDLDEAATIFEAGV